MARKSSRRSRGGGYSVTPSSMISPGNVVYSQYDGAGKDCVSAPSPSIMTRLSSMFGGKRRSRRRGGYVPQAAALPEVGAPFQAPAPVVPVAPVAKQAGGRYGVDLSHSLGHIGMSSYAPIQHVPCEHSRHMSGGFQAADMMQIRAPTAGYGHGFEAFPGTSSVGGLMTTTPYDARASNPACHTTGGKRHSYGKRRTQKKTRKVKSRKQRK